MCCGIEQYRCAVGRFAFVLVKILTRKALIAAKRIRGFRAHGFAAKLAVATLLAMLLIGGVESNPGPNGSDRMGDTNDSDGDSVASDSKLDSLTKMMQFMSDGMTRIEAGQAEQTSKLDRRLSAMEAKIDSRLQEISGAQAQLTDEVNTLKQTCGELQTENDQLYDKVSALEDKLDSLENQSRRNNLLFYGLPTVSGETWDECEAKVMHVINSMLGISKVSIERAHRVGTAIIAKFSSYKDRELVLSKCKQLKGTAVSVSEDVSAMVRSKQKGLVPLKRELQKQGKKARIRFDKLHSDEGVFTFDLRSQTLKKLSSYPPPPQKTAPDQNMNRPHPPPPPPPRPAEENDTQGNMTDETRAKELYSSVVVGGSVSDKGGAVGGGGVSSGRSGKKGGQGYTPRTRVSASADRSGGDKSTVWQSKITQHVSRADSLTSTPTPTQRDRSQSAKRQRVSVSPGSGSESMECVNTS